MKTIFVTGDLVWDTHIARLPWASQGYHQPHGQSQLKNCYGGAWYLKSVIEGALNAEKSVADNQLKRLETELKEARDATAPAAKPEDVKTLENKVEEAAKLVTQCKERFAAMVSAPHKARHEEIEENSGPGGIAKGFSVWEWFDEGKAGTWRIREFLGCQAAPWKRGKEPDGALCQKLVDHPEKPGGVPIEEVSELAKPDMLVIDDLGLGFASERNAWPPCLLNDPSEGPAAIIVKASIPFDRPLWAEKLLTPRWADRVTVVVSAAALRDAGARLGRGFSWDQTIYEVKAAFQTGGTCWPLRLSRRVIVTFGRSGAAVFSREAQSPELPQQAETLQFERLVFDPAHLEQTWSDKANGDTFGTASIMTASMVLHELQDKKPSSHLSVSRGLEAARELRRMGAGSDASLLKLKGIEDACLVSAVRVAPELKFRSAFNRDLLDDPVLMKKEDVPKPEDQTLLTDAVGLSSEFLTVAAQEIVRFGWKRSLNTVPRLELGKYFTVDRQEIERLNSVRHLINDYQDNKVDPKPLSIAVFGPPGSGKSFAIKQLSEALFGKAKAVLEFNLSQFEDLDALHEAFHDVRDRSVQGQLPVVFWDEFDSVRDKIPLGWLKEFLAPMQDAKFFVNGREHPFGKCIFIFAGGTKSTFDEFDRSADGKEQHFKDVKGPDFVSRLRGFVNIKGPNPTAEKGDEVHVVRRALLLRSLIERHHKDIIQRETEEIVIHPAVLDAFLNVKKYCHGARSMESIVSMCRLHEGRHFGPSELPPKELVQLHVSEDFSEIVEDQKRMHIGPADIERLAAIMHTNWARKKMEKPEEPGKTAYVYGPVRNDEAAAGPLTHPLCRPFEELSDAEKEGNRKPARLTLLRLGLLDCEVCRPELIDGRQPLNLDQDTKLLDLIARSEHRRWMREKLLEGKAYAMPTSDALMLHSDLQKFDTLEHPEKKLDHAIAQAIQQFLGEQGLVLVRKVK